MAIQKRKNRKAFTLIELLGVLIILSAIVLISFPSILNQIKKSKVKIDSATKLLISSATSLFLKENQNDYGYINGDTYCISLQQLVSNGKLEKPIKDSSGKELDLSMFVQAKVKDGKEIDYDLVESCQEQNTTPIIPDDPGIIPDKNKNAPKIEILSSNVLPIAATTFDAMEGVVITDDKTPMSEIKVTVTGSVTLGVIGRYPIVYEAIDSDGNLATEIRIIEVAILEYTITFHENRATTDITSLPATLNEDVTLPNNPFTAKYGFTFKEWNTQANGTGTSYQAGEVVQNLHEKKNSTIDLYAIWERPDILYLFNGGVPSGMSFNANPANVTATVGSTLYLKSGWYKFPSITSSAVDVTGYKMIHVTISVSIFEGATFGGSVNFGFGGQLYSLVPPDSSSGWVRDSGTKSYDISNRTTATFTMNAGNNGASDAYTSSKPTEFTITQIWLTK